MRKVLFASSEVHPLIKTGGLADVSASLPIALHTSGYDIRIVLPAYRQCLNALTDTRIVATLTVEGYDAPVEILASTLPNSTVPILLVNAPTYFDRDGGAYADEQGIDWADNAARFALFSRVIVLLAMNQAGLDWPVDILHCNDWQTGLAPALIADLPNRPRTVFTVHNLAYQGLYPYATFEALALPSSLWHSEGLEFYDQLSFIKGGLIYSDHVTTVSPTYADEICTAEFGYGLEGLLSKLASMRKLTGIMNGIDLDEWNPKTDTAIYKKYTAKTLKNKLLNKTAIQRHFALPTKDDAMVIGLISRLVAQKGIDLSIEAVSALLSKGKNIQLVCLGSGEPHYEQALRVLRARYPDRVGLTIGYDEQLAHQIEAGADVFLMPSRFEPCGLNQLYSLRYGTLPVVRNTGGLADSVVDASGSDLKHNFATGFKFNDATAEALQQSLQQALDLYAHPRIWRKVMLKAMEQDYSWETSAYSYQRIYHLTRG